MEKKGLLLTYLLSLVNFNISRVQVVHGDVITYRQNVDKLAEQQQSKYLDLYTILPSEISMQLAEVSLALGAIEDQVLVDLFYFFLSGHMHPLHWEAQVDISAVLFQVLSKEREIQRTREIKDDFSSRINDVSEKLKAISAKFKEKSPDVDHAKEEVKVGQLPCFTRKYKLFTLEKNTFLFLLSQSLSENLDTCGRVLIELDYSVQEFGRRNPLLAKQLGDAISKLSEMHRHTTRLADCRNNWLKKVSFFRFACCPVCRFVF